MIKVFRPFWSYDVYKTERWLSAMAKKGYYFVALNRWTRCFSFTQGEPKTIVYRIAFDKMQGASLSKTLVDEGWSMVVHSGNWYIISNEKSLEEIRTTSVRDGIVKHNRKISYLFSGILIYLSCIVLFNLTLLGFTLFNEISVEVVESPMWLITYMFIALALGIYVLSIYSIYKIKKTNRDFMNEKPTKIQGEIHSVGKINKSETKRLKQTGKMIVKRKFGWMYAPDKLEKWLETMEQRGFNLYRVNKLGTGFYFIKGSPRKISYCADYQNVSDESYFDIHRSAGWKSVFVSYSSIQKWTIWSREYAAGEEKPQIYSDKTYHLKQARRVAIAYSALFLPVVIMYIFNLVLFIANLSNGYSNNLSLINAFLFIFALFMFGSFTVRTWLYYMRLKKRYDFQW